MNMSPQAAIAYAKKVSDRCQELHEQNLELASEMTGCLQVSGYLLKKYCDGTLLVPRAELATFSGGLRVKEMKNDMLLIVAVTQEEIEQAGKEAQADANVEGSEGAR